MSKVAFLFAGQGAQYPGMGQDIYENFPAAKAVFEQASSVMGMDMAELCFKGSPEALAQTGNSQPAIFTHALAVFAVLKEQKCFPAGYAGFSLGECTALTAAGALTYLDGFKVIRERAQAMQQAAESSNGAMAAIMGLDADKITDICNKIPGLVEAVNYNCPGQTVIAGDKAAVEQAVTDLSAAGAKKAIPLKVNAAFHTPLMKEAAIKFNEAISNIEWQTADAPIYSDIDAKPNSFTASPAEYLTKQINSAVIWQKLIEQMIIDGFDTFVELGPGKALSGFTKRINRGVTIMNAEDSNSIAAVVAALA